MKRLLTMPRVFVIAGVIFVGQAALVQAQTSPPAAPSDVHVFGGVLQWKDNSTDEDGFIIDARIFGSTSGAPDVQHSYRVGPNVTTFPLPPEALPDCNRAYADWRVRAFRGDTVSEFGLTGIVGDCGVQEPPVLPATGSGWGNPVSESSALMAALAAFGGIALIYAGMRVAKSQTISQTRDEG